MAMPEAGSKAPAFALSDQTGKTVKLADLKGKSVVLYFYPRDDTSGCTKEACAFRDEHAKLEKAGAVVLGVSADGAASHTKFAAEYKLPFQLLVDEDHAVSNKYGTWARSPCTAGNTWVCSARPSSSSAVTARSGRSGPRSRSTGTSTRCPRRWADVLQGLAAAQAREARLVLPHVADDRVGIGPGVLRSAQPIAFRRKNSFDSIEGSMHAWRSSRSVAPSEGV